MGNTYILRKGVSHYTDLVNDYQRRDPLFVDTFTGSDGNDGKSWEKALATMTRALALVQTGGKIYLFGKVAEECVGSNLVFDVTIEGVGSLHHADQPGSGTNLYHYGSAVWQSPGSAAAPLLDIRGRGWKVYNILFDAPTSYAAIRLTRNSSSGTSEYDAGHASIIGCDFRNGLYGIQNYDGCYNVTVQDCVFETLDATTSAAAIVDTANTGVAAPRRWRIINNFFQPDSTTEGNERHIVIGLVGSLIKGNVFGTVKNTGKYIDLTNGSNNVVTGNYMMGAYDASDYVAGTSDSWFGNQTISINFGGGGATGTATNADGVSISAPTTAT